MVVGWFMVFNASFNNISVISWRYGSWILGSLGSLRKKKIE